LGINNSNLLDEWIGRVKTGVRRYHSVDFEMISLSVRF
jgi:hypothetical protein